MTVLRKTYTYSPGITLALLLALEALTLVLFYSTMHSITGYVAIASDSHPGFESRGFLSLLGSAALFLCALSLGVFLLVRAIRDLQQSQAREDFMNAVSHDLKTPLTLMQLYGETLLYQGLLSEEERKMYANIIVRQSKKLTHLIDQVLDLSRIEKAHKRYCLQEGDLAPAVGEAVKDYVPYLHQQGFSVEVEVAPRLPRVQFDRDAVSKAVINLLDNARKYSGEPKSIAIRLWSESDKVIFEVRDCGIGIPQDLQKKVFEPFYRVNPVTSHPTKRGHGLGLFLVGHIMEAHGGTIELRSDGQLGSRFQLVFPAVKKPAQSRFSFGYLKEQFAGAAAHTDHASTNAGGN